ncbi:MAG: adenylate/guanylate cyclase domain-containing protein [Fuerstiella sp.]|nr:adenylate/guanylate cyclase domain-containing protein [Fuerstiella sp.]MCP4505700.1 adenylate/guanylate cyclase domain-containing protein [Fuerstiella sp.]
MLRITVRNSQQSDDFTLPHGKQAALGRLVTAAEGVLDVWLKDSTCSRSQLRITDQSDGLVLVENLSVNVAVHVPGGAEVGPLGTITLVCPFALSAGATEVTVQRCAADAVVPQSASGTKTPSLHAVKGQVNPTQFWSGNSAKPNVELSQANLLDWFSALIAVQRSVAGSTDFYREIADAAVELIGLDYGLVLLLNDGTWSCVAANGIEKVAATWSQTVIQQTIQERRTFYGPLDDLGPVPSLAALNAVVAAPVLRVDESVVGVIYGARRMSGGQLFDGSTREAGVSELQAQLVQLLAASAATGLARAENEAEAARIRGQFEDFCSPKVVLELHNNPRLLEPSERSISVMFCDIRGFTKLCERLSPAEANNITAQILDRIAECILGSAGLIIDFYGDGIAAMWNAPCVQKHHARLAVDCGTQIQHTLSQLKADSRHPQQQKLRVGIGVHTGIAVVGNVGGTRRLKYGPRGTTVNMASRIEGATKHLGVDFLMSAETAAQAGVTPPEGRRIGHFQLAETDNTVELVQHLGANSSHYSADELRTFASAVTMFEADRIRDAEKLLAAYLRSSCVADRDSVARVLIDEIQMRSQNRGDTHPPHIQIHKK